MKQQSLLKNTNETRGRPRTRPENCFGGNFHKNYNPNEQRPIQSNKALHVVLKSNLAKGAKSFLNKNFEEKIWILIQKHAGKNRISIYEYANAGNHLHLLIRAKRRDDYCRFIRTITGLIARMVGKTEKGTPLGEKFWDARPFTRIVSFSKNDFQKVKLYLKRNIWESIGFTPYIERSKKLTPQWKRFWKNLVTIPG